MAPRPGQWRRESAEGGGAWSGSPHLSPLPVLALDAEGGGGGSLTSTCHPPRIPGGIFYKLVRFGARTLGSVVAPSWAWRERLCPLHSQS